MQKINEWGRNTKDKQRVEIMEVKGKKKEVYGGQGKVEENKRKGMEREETGSKVKGREGNERKRKGRVRKVKERNEMKEKRNDQNVGKSGTQKTKATVRGKNQEKKERNDE